MPDDKDIFSELDSDGIPGAKGVGGNNGANGKSGARGVRGVRGVSGQKDLRRGIPSPCKIQKQNDRNHNIHHQDRELGAGGERNDIEERLSSNRSFSSSAGERSSISSNPVPASNSVPASKPIPAPSNMPSNAVNKRVIVWRDGVPVPESHPIIPKDGVEKLALTALSMPFEPVPLRENYEDDIEREKDRMRYEKEKSFQGLTNAEVMMIRLAESAASGDLASAKELMDRILGRPKQQIESKSMHMSYSDYLSALAEEEKNRVHYTDTDIESDKGKEEKGEKSDE